MSSHLPCPVCSGTVIKDLRCPECNNTGLVHPKHGYENAPEPMSFASWFMLLYGLGLVAALALIYVKYGKFSAFIETMRKVVDGL